MHLRRLLMASVVSLALCAGAAQARGQLQAQQTSVELAAGARSGRLVLANAGDTPVSAQIRVYAWTQDGSEDRLEPSADVVASPAIVEIAPGGEQLVRLVRANGAAVAAEQTYRVVVDELPGDPGADETSAITVRMRYLIPMFLRAADAAPAKLACNLTESSLACRNTGGRAAQLGASRLLGANGRALELSPGLLGYVLAGHARSFSIDATKLGSPATWTSLEVRLNGEPATIALPSH